MNGVYKNIMEQIVPKESISKSEIEVYLMSKRACREAIKTFRRLYEREYIREIVCKRS
jgi:hypothetical protein